MPTLVSQVGHTGHNSYASLEYADAYFDDRLHADDWTEASTDTKERALIMATAEIDASFQFRGRRSTREQPLQFPRYGIYDIDGYYVDDEVIPKELQAATTEYAKLLIKDNRPIKSPEPDSVGVGSISVGGIGISFDRYDRKKRIPDIVSNLIRSYIRNKTEGFHSVRIRRS